MGREHQQLPPEPPSDPRDQQDVKRRMEQLQRLNLISRRGGFVSPVEVIKDSVLRIGRRIIGGGFASESINRYRTNPTYSELDSAIPDKQARRILRVQRIMLPAFDAKLESNLEQSENPSRPSGLIDIDIAKRIDRASYFIIGTAALLIIFTSIGSGLLPTFALAGGTFAMGKLLYNATVQTIVELPTLVKRLRTFLPSKKGFIKFFKRHK